MDWTDSKQRALESYIRSYLSTLPDPTKLYEGLNWKKIATLTGLEPDNDTALFKIDELYDEYLIQIQGNTPASWQGPHNSVWVEAEEAVAGLRLETNNEPAQFVSESVSEPTMAPGPPKQPSRPPVASELRARRGSLNLIERPLGFKNGPTYKHSESKALLTTAETSTTNVNVITRSEIGFRAPREVPKKPQILSSIQQVSNRFKHLVKKRSNSKLDVSEPISTMERQRRRSSVVGMNLPLYIRRQLQEEAESHQKESEAQSSALVEPDTVPGHSRSTSESKKPSAKEGVVQEPEVSRKKSTRLQNLLSNSQSLYLRSSDGAQSPDPFADSEVEAQDKEYISPNSLTRFYNDDSDSSHEVLRALDDDDVDFVNLHESEDELRAIQEDDDRDDDYLFKI